LIHGWGIFSLFYHLDSFAGNYAVGDYVKKGNPIGKLGKTGYASGYHLHWEMRINNIEIDPLEWTKPGF
jgi:murein DD-endopeptidase MepM/ murein hydrolase activator NlpD